LANQIAPFEKVILSPQYFNCLYATVWQMDPIAEIVGANLAAQRERDLADDHPGLGPEDLVSLTKQENSFFFRPRIGHSYHHISGLSVGSEAVFAAYFAEVVQRSPPAARYTIVHGKLFSYNSFQRRDVVISAKNPGTCSATTVNAKGRQTSVRPRVWTQLRISTMLRFFRGPQPLHSLLLGSPVQTTLNVVCSWDPKLTVKDFTFIAKNHPVSDELQFSLACSLFACATTKEIREFLERWHAKYDQVFRWLATFITGSGQLCAFFAPVFEANCPADTMHGAIALVSFWLVTGDIEKCDQVVPLLRTSIQAEPVCGITLARICLARRERAKALVYLNASGCSKGWPPDDQTLPEFVTSVPEGSIPSGPSHSEEWLVTNPIAGINYEYFAAVVQLFKAAGRDPFAKLIHQFSIWCSKPSDELNALFDLAIPTSEPAAAWISGLPYSGRLQRAVAAVTGAAQRITTYLRRSRVDFLPATVIQLIAAVRMGDDELMQLLRNDQHVCGGLEKAVLIRAALLGIGPKMEDIMGLKSRSETMTEHVTLKLMAVIGQAFIRHVQSCTDAQAE
jgi:hypothetical protein